ncbi:general secretion pathway protein G [Clostridium sp. CAG:768]|nr:general secretion pathway protein G [Clostridium sp. CAG:768]
MCCFPYARSARGGGDLELAPQGFRRYSHSEGIYPKESSLLLKLKAGLLRQKSRNDRFGFTLAEVLITLGIIGVVAALTIPTLIENYQKRQVVESLKIAYSIFLGVIEKAKLDYGDVENWDWNLLSSDRAPTDGNEFVNKYIIPYIKVVPAKLKYEQAKQLDGSIVSSGTSMYLYKPKYVLTNGMTFSYYATWGYSDDHSLVLSIDINGYNRPNRMGRDLFIFLISKSSPNLRFGYNLPLNIKREDLLKSNGTCSKDFVGAGWGCSALIMLDGWQIKDDYPW